MTQQPKPVTAQRLIATATACGYLNGINPRTRAQAANLARALDGISLDQAATHTLAWNLGGRRADTLARIIATIRAER
jgi:hypothetical protein